MNQGTSVIPAMDLFTWLQSWGTLPTEAFLIVVTTLLALAMRGKANKKDVKEALEQKADKLAMEDLKQFIQSRFDDMQLRFDDVKTFLIELSKKS